MPLFSGIERGKGIRSGIRELRFNSSNIAAGITGFIFSLSGVVLIFSSVGKEAGLTQEQIISWLFIGFAVGGALSVFFSLYYRMPIVIASPLAALALVGVQYRVFSLPYMCGAFILAGAMVFVIGISGIVAFIKRFLPIPIVMGMIAGVFMSYAIKVIYAVQAHPLICIAILASYFIAMRLGFKKVPPQLVALVVSALMALLFLPPEIPTGGLGLSMARPVFIAPAFSFDAFMNVSLPLVLLVLTDVINGYGIMKVQGYDPPLNSLVSASGLASVFSGFAMAHAVSFVSAGTAIVVTEAGGPHEHRYAASVIKNCFTLLIAITLGFTYPFLSVIPVHIANILAGLALLSIFTSSLKNAFGSGDFRTGAFAAMIIGITNVSIGTISAPILAIGCGILVSLLAEWKDFKKLKSGGSME